MRHYETMFILKPTLTAEEAQARIEFFKSIIVREGGEVAGVEDWGVKQLAYRIDNKYDRGHYVVIYFKAPSKLIPELERNLRVTEDVIRFIIIKYQRQVELKAWNKMVEKANKVA
ncbi:MAG: 30S ribosomal protein S6 [Campylobacterales bacterium]